MREKVDWFKQHNICLRKTLETMSISGSYLSATFVDTADMDLYDLD